MLADKQAGLEKDIIHTEGRLAELVSGFNEAESVILTAAQWASTLGTAYQAADETVRRQFNQAIFKRIFISERGVERVEFTEGFAELLEVCLPATARESVKRSEAREGTNSKSLTTDGEALEPDSVVLGWNVERLVEVAGIEPASFDVLPVLLRAQPMIRFSGPPLAIGSGGGPQSAKHVPDGLPTQPSGESH